MRALEEEKQREIEDLRYKVESLDIVVSEMTTEVNDLKSSLFNTEG